MNQSNRREVQYGVRVVVEVDGNPVGSLNLDIDRLWPLINHGRKESKPVEWIDAQRYETVVRAAVIKNLMNRLQSHLYQALGNEIVKAQLDIESFNLKAETAAQIFGRTRAEIESLVSEAGRSNSDFYTFFWEYMLDEREGIDLKKEWRALAKKA
jgi:hypothetical protein